MYNNSHPQVWVKISYEVRDSGGVAERQLGTERRQVEPLCNLAEVTYNLFIF